MNHVFKTLYSSVLALCFLFMGTAHAQSIDWQSRLNEENLQAGEMHLAMHFEGEVAGFMRLGWNVDGDTLMMFDRTMWADPEIFESMEGQIDLATFSPERFDIRFFIGSAYQHLDINYEDEMVIVDTEVVRPGMETLRRETETIFPAGGWARAMMFIFVATTPMEVGEEMSVTWFSPLDGQVEDVTLKAIELETIETPAGTHDAMHLTVTGGGTDLDFYVDIEDQEIVRIDVGGMDMKFMAIAELN